MINLETIGLIPDSELAKNSRIGVQLGYHLSSAPQTEQEQQLLNSLQQDSFDLSTVKSQAMERLPIEEKTRIIDKFCANQPILISYKNWLIENAFHLNLIYHKDTTLFLTITDFDCGVRLLSFLNSIDKITSEMVDGKITISPEIEYDRGGYYLRIFKNLLTTKFKITENDDDTITLEKL